MFRVLAARADLVELGRPGDTFHGWLWTITRNKVRDLWRRQQTQPVAAGGSEARDRLLEVAAADSSSAAAPPAGDGRGPLGRAVDRVRAECEDRTWRAFWSVAVDGRAVADVARELGMSANAVYVARSRVLRRLRDALADGPADSDLSGAG